MEKIQRIKFIRKNNNDSWEIYYKKGATKIINNGRLPLTAQHFIILSETQKRTETRDGFEIVYNMGG